MATGINGKRVGPFAFPSRRKEQFLKRKREAVVHFCGCWQSREVKKGVTKVSKKGEEERRKKGGGLREFHSFLP